MHPKNLHKNGYDFDILCSKHPELNKHVIKSKLGEATIDFSNDKSVFALNKALLLVYYNLKYWTLPPGHLCPSIPGRSEYIHIINDLLSRKNSNTGILDIGTSASIIYPLLGISLYGWNFVGSECNRHSVSNAHSIIKSNPHLREKIELRLQSNSQKIFEGVISSKDYFHATICNPPFYVDADEAQRISNRKWKKLGLPHKSDQKNFRGVNSELHYPGGEVKFIEKMIIESKKFGNNVGWFTSLISQKGNIKQILKFLLNEKPKDYKIIEMKIGQKTTRILAWRFNQRI